VAYRAAFFEQNNNNKKVEKKPKYQYLNPVLIK